MAHLAKLQTKSRDPPARVERAQETMISLIPGT